MKPKAISRTSVLQIVLLGEIIIGRDRHGELFIDLEHKLKRLQDRFLPSHFKCQHPLLKYKSMLFFKPIALGHKLLDCQTADSGKGKKIPKCCLETELLGSSCTLLPPSSGC